ncbi:hypothetical protein [Methanosarcina sp. UBA289]|uniref:hypothetical protein n=1 Tax=Methanosarcina sp. UBA289 TaxID=1915574 RepID=UPI0025FB2AC5|nr:hypothetical protein [Methanosarcina sp. UBA289]
MLLVIQFDIDADIIDVPQTIIENAGHYQDQFHKWLSNKAVNHSYWFYKDGKKYGLIFRSDAFVEWLNKYPLKENSQKAKIVSQHSSEYEKALPILFF